MKHLLTLLLLTLLTANSYAQKAPRPEDAVRPGQIGQVLKTLPGDVVGWADPTAPSGSVDTFTMTNKSILRVPKAGDKITGNKWSDYIRWHYYRAPTLALSHSPTTTLTEVGNVINYTLTNTTSNPGGATLANGRFERDGTQVATFGSATSATHPFTFSPGAPSGNNALQYTFRSRQDYSGGGDAPGTAVNPTARTFRAAYPILYGMSTTDLTQGGNPYTVLFGKLVETEGNKSVPISGSGYIYYAIPASWGDTALSLIQDGNNYNVTAGFTPYNVTVTSTGRTNNYTAVPYILYRSNGTSTISSPLTFKFTQ